MKNKLWIVSVILSLVLVLGIALSGCAAPVTSTETTTLTTSAPAITSTVTSTTILVSTTTIKPPTTLNISAASSLTNVLNALSALYVQQNPGVTIVPNYGSSGTLQTQISNGAPADLFFSAAEAQMDTLQSQNLLLANSRKDLLNNSIVLIVPPNSTLNIHSFNDLTNANVKLIAIGDPKSVPAGTYATLAFNELGITAQLQPKEVLGANVSQVLTYVESGNVDAGIVYSTDALSAGSKVTVVATGPADVNAQITYPIAIINTTKVANPAADYINFLSTPQATAIFQQFGFNIIK